MAENMGNPELTRLFVYTMERSNKGVARDIWLKFIGELTIDGALLDARRELESLRESIEADETGERSLVDSQLAMREADLSFLEREAEEAERVTLSLVKYLVSSGDLGRAIDQCLSFVGKYPYATQVISRLIELYRDEKRTHKLGGWYRRLGIAAFFKGQTYEAISAFIKAIEMGEHDAAAFNFLFEIVDSQGRIKKIPFQIRSLRCLVYKSLGSSGLAIGEMERELTGTPSDEPIYIEIG